MTDSTTKPGIEERYTSATDASNLRVEADRGGDADLLIANGWSQSRLGAALMRLHSEWDGAQKPPKPDAKSIEALAASYSTKLSHAYRVTAAREEAEKWHLHELQLLFQKLKTLPEVRNELAGVVARWGIPFPTEVAGAVVGYWLDQTCQPCDGRKWQVIPGSPSLSNRVCPVCHGSGIAKIPHGNDGKRLANYMDDCVSISRASIKRRLHSLTNRA